MTKAAGHERWRGPLTLALAITTGALGVWQRLLAAPAVFVGSETFLSPTDAYYYARLAKLSMAAFPHPVAFDSYVAFPGMAPPWPPGHAWLLGALLSVAHLEPFEPAGLRLLAWAGLGLGLSVCAAVAFIAWRVYGRWALLSAAVMLLMPAVVSVTEVGEIDHHGYEVLLGAVVTLSWVRGTQAVVAPLRWALLGGTALGLGHFVCTSAFLFAPPLAAASWVVHLAAQPRRFRQSRLALGLLAFAWPWVAVEAAWLGRVGVLDPVRLSGFHLLLLSLSLLAVAVAHSRFRIKRLLGSERAVVALSALACAALISGGWRAISESLAQLFRHSQVLANADESEPLFSSGLGTETLGAGLLWLPALLALLAYAVWRRRPGLFVAPLVMLSIWVAWTCLQNRFARPMAGVAAALVPLAAKMAFDAGPTLRRVSWAFATAVFVTLPSAWHPARLHPVLQLSRSTLAFLRTQTPPTSGLWNDGSPPSSCVLAPWVMGHVIAALAERPALASPFGQVREAEQAAELAARAYAETDAARLETIIEATGARYVLAMPYPGDGLPQSWLEKLRRGPALLGHLRQRFVSSERFGPFPFARVYERVLGAHLELSGASQDRWTLRARLKSGELLEETGALDLDGRASLTLAVGADDLAEPASLELPSGPRRFWPSEAAVALGREVDWVEPK